MALPLECLREAERHPCGLAVRLRSRTAPSSLVPSHVRSVSTPRFERGLVVDLYTPSHASRLRDLSRILIESVPAVEAESESFWKEVEQVTGIRRTEESVELVEEPYAKSDLVSFVSFLFDRNYLTEDDVPYGDGPVQHILNSENTNKKGDEMRSPEKVADGVYLESHGSKQAIRERIVELGELVRARHN